MKKRSKPISSEDLKALQLNCRFSLPPNSLGYCGHNSAPEKFKACVIKGKSRGVKSEVTKFIVLHPYLRTISKILEEDLLSYDVVESYWLGNSNLRKVKSADYTTLLKFFKKQGVPEWLVDELAQSPPKKFIPTHLFQVLHVGVGRASGSVPYNIDSINNCMIRWGKVLKVTETDAIVSLNSLKKTGNKYRLIKIKDRFPLITGFVPNIKIGATVTVHWKQITKVLTQAEVNKITYWTKEVIDAING